MSEQPESRIADAKNRAWDTKQRLVVGAAAGFVGLVGVAWASHPGEANTSPPQETSSTDDSTLRSDDFGGFDSFGSIRPAGGSSPQMQSSVS